MGRTVLDGADTGRDGKTMKNHKKTITMLLTAAVLLAAVFMTGCAKLSKASNSTPSEVDAPAESDGFGVYVKLERIEEMTARMGGDGRIQ